MRLIPGMRDLAKETQDSVLIPLLLFGITTSNSSFSYYCNDETYYYKHLSVKSSHIEYTGHTAATISSYYWLLFLLDFEVPERSEWSATDFLQ